MSVLRQTKRIWETRRGSLMASAAFFAFAFFAPPCLQAHGELLIRIAAVSQQIQATTNNPARLYLQRGELYREDQNWDAAASDYKQAAQHDSGLRAVDFCQAKLLADSGQLKAGLALFDKVVAALPNDGEVLMARGRLLAKLGQRDIAVRDFQHALELLVTPQPEYFLECAQALKIQGEAEQALRSLDAGIRKFGPIVLLQKEAVEIDIERKNYNSAVARLDTIIDLMTRKEEWLARRGDVFLLANRLEEARKSYKAALKSIDLLPRRLQQGPAMLKLQSHIHASLPVVKIVAENE